VVSRIVDVRFIGPLIGRYALESRAKVKGVQIFACRLQSISARQVVMSAPVSGQVEEGITAHFGPFGTVRGAIGRHIEGGFAVDLDLCDEGRHRLAAKIDWFKKRTFAGVTDKREHRRYMPKEPRSALVLASGLIIPCLVIDISASGAAVSANHEPAIGEPLAIGGVVARVVRRLEVGFAVQFVAEQTPAQVEGMLRAPAKWKGVLGTSEAEAVELATAGEDLAAVG
jgi:hypothetical protein